MAPSGHFFCTFFALEQKKEDEIELSVHRELHSRIQDFPYHVKDLAGAIADRILADTPGGGKFARRSLGVLWAAREGAVEWGVAEMVEANGSEWAIVRRALDPLLRYLPDSRLTLSSPPIFNV